LSKNAFLPVIEKFILLEQIASTLKLSL
jgi:hypothetical protein